MSDRVEHGRNSSEGSTAAGGREDSAGGHLSAEDRQVPRPERSRSPQAAKEEKTSGPGNAAQKSHGEHPPRGWRAVTQKLGKMLPDYYTAAFHDPRAWKTFIRCMIAVFATLVLLLCQTCEFDSTAEAVYISIDDCHSSERNRLSDLLRLDCQSG